MILYFIALLTTIFTASALPTDIGNKATNVSYTNVVGRPSGFGAETRGGEGGAVWTVWDSWALRDAISSNAARTIYVRGRIDLTQLFTGSPGVYLHIGAFKSLIGGDNNAEIYGGGFRLSRNTDIIIQNIKFHNAISYGPGERPDGNGGIIGQQPGPFSLVDAIDVNNSSRVWIDHCEFSDDPWNAASVPTNQRRHDGLIDIRSGSSWVSVSNNIFRNHNLVSLVGSSDSVGAQDIGRLKVTFYNNWYQGTTQRNPRVRFGEVHVLNNLYTGITGYGIGIGAAAEVYGERNVFIDCRRAWAFADGTPSPMGYFFNHNNRLVNSSLGPIAVPPNVKWHPDQYYRYSPMAVGSVEAYVRNNAGTFRI